MRRPRAKHEASVSLFPFLAVLLCTMGSLIVILVVLSHQARASAARAQQQNTAPHDEQAQVARDELQWRIEHLLAARDQTAKDLQQERLRLSHVEDHMRRLRDERQRLLAAANALRQSDDANAGKRQEVEQELAHLQQQIAQLTEQLRTAHRRAANVRPTYSIVPYEGSNGTRRRPIFIECLADSVVLQPEGVVLTPDDFDEPLGPGNPLATALRASREYLVRNAAPGSDVEPYPLLLVRPEGVLAYYQARRAIESWGPDFGYQLIDADWKLEYPQTDRGLAEIERRAVEQGRQLQQRLRAAAPGAYGRRRPTYRAARRGGGVVREGSSVTRRNGSGNATAGGRGSAARNYNAGRGSAARDGRYANASNTGQAASGYGSSRGGQGNAGASGAGRGRGAASGRGDGSGGPHGSLPGGGQQFRPNDLARSHEAAGNGPNSRAGQMNHGPNGGPAPSTAAGPQQSFAAGQPGARGTSGGTSGQQQSSAGAQAGAGQQRAGDASQQGGSAGLPSFSQAARGQSTGNSGRRFGQQKSGSKGRNWALKDATRTSVPIRRPVRVFCREDRFVLAEDRSFRNGKQVPVSGPTESAVDDFVNTLWEHMEGWGIAGNGLHWKPELILQVGPDGAGRAQDLARLLEGSGVETRYEQQARP